MSADDKKELEYYSGLSQEKLVSELDSCLQRVYHFINGNDSSAPIVQSSEAELPSIDEMFKEEPDEVSNWGESYDEKTSSLTVLDFSSNITGRIPVGCMAIMTTALGVKSLIDNYKGNSELLAMKIAAGGQIASLEEVYEKFANGEVEESLEVEIDPDDFKQILKDTEPANISNDDEVSVEELDKLVDEFQTENDNEEELDDDILSDLDDILVEEQKPSTIKAAESADNSPEEQQKILDDLDDLLTDLIDEEDDNFSNPTAEKPGFIAQDEDDNFSNPTAQLPDVIAAENSEEIKALTEKHKDVLAKLEDIFALSELTISDAEAKHVEVDSDAYQEALEVIDLTSKPAYRKLADALEEKFKFSNDVITQEEYIKENSQNSADSAVDNKMKPEVQAIIRKIEDDYPAIPAPDKIENQSAELEEMMNKKILSGDIELTKKNSKTIDVIESMFSISSNVLSNETAKEATLEELQKMGNDNNADSAKDDLTQTFFNNIFAKKINENNNFYHLEEENSMEIDAEHQSVLNDLENILPE